jgi:hypothetical protein
MRRFPQPVLGLCRSRPVRPDRSDRQVGPTDRLRMTGVRRTLYGATSLRRGPAAPVGGGSFASGTVDHADPIEHLPPRCIAAAPPGSAPQHEASCRSQTRTTTGPIFAVLILEERVATRQHRSNCADRCAKAWVSEAERHERDPVVPTRARLRRLGGTRRPSSRHRRWTFLRLRQ